MKFDGFPGEKTILSFKLENGVGWLTTHRLIIQQEKHNPRFNIMERQDPEMYLLRDFEKAEIKDENLTVHFKGKQKATIRLQLNSPALLQEIKNYIDEATKALKGNVENSVREFNWKNDVAELKFTRGIALDEFLTDSGGLQEETCVLGVPGVALRDNMERPET